ncbi:hypothetical protein M23134_02970 [Microscilla marina ATCC 23134]|uniref:Uncharacterized protein n=2 Tax=Microscilla marina TaxID=1027 RepID=A1ZSH1_MICM2|nr:hypothetical protein M23134_02970 [Microscilla marina ATCC 23134]
MDKLIKSIRFYNLSFFNSTAIDALNNLSHTLYQAKESKQVMKTIIEPLAMCKAAGFFNQTNCIKQWAIGALVVACMLVGKPQKANAQVSPPRSISEAESIINDRKLKVSGGVSATQIFYGASGIESRRDPYTYFLSGNLTFSMFSVSVPLTFSYTNQEFSFSHQLPSVSFNQYGIQPTYKWLKFYAGYNTMTLSPYTMSGHLFLGGGIEAKPPGRFSATALYGRFQKATMPDSTGQGGAFQRMGYGVKVGIHFNPRPNKHRPKVALRSKYTRDGEPRAELKTPTNSPKEPTKTASFSDNTDLLELIVFGAKDQVNSLPNLEDSTGLFPEENVVLSARINKTLFKKFSVDAEIATSAITADVRTNTKDENRQTVFLVTDGFFTRKTNTAYYNAYKGQLNYNHSSFTIGVGYERVDPEYRTHGAYFFNNDFENLTLNFSTQLWQGKFSVSGSLGSQRNNLNDQNLSTLRRASGSVNVNMIPHPKLNVSLSYSNFQSFTRVQNQFEVINQLTPFDNLRDSLNFTQIAQNANVSINYQVVNHPEHRQFWNANANVQVASGEGGNNSLGTVFYNASTSYNFNWSKIGFTTVLSLNYSQNEAEAALARTVGPTLTLSKTLLKKKLRLSLAASLNNSYLAENLTGSIINFRLNGGYTLLKKHRINLNVLTLRRNATDTNRDAFAEFTGTLGYSYSF